MDSKIKLDLVGVVSPLCLMKCKSCLQSMTSGEIVEVRIEDPDVVDELVVIIGRSKDLIIDRKREKDCHRIRIRKG